METLAIISEQGKEAGVKNSIFGLLLCMAMAMFCVQAQAAEDKATPEQVNNVGDPVKDFTGKYWADTSDGSKEAYLFGIESAIAVENAISSLSAANAAKSGKKPVYTLSPFEKGWMEAFKNTTRKEMMAELDKWYASHPDSMDRPVLDVMWYEIIRPRLNTTGKK